MKKLILTCVAVAAFAAVASAQLGDPGDWVKYNSGGWSNRIGAAASATVGGQTNLTRLEVPSTARSLALEFDGYLFGGASTAGTNVHVTIRKSVKVQGNAAGTWLTAYQAYTNTEPYVTWLIPIAAGSARIYGTTNLLMTAGSGLEWYPNLYVHHVNLGFTDNGPMTNWLIRASFQK